MNTAGSARTWWLLPHALGVDAAAVAAVWCLLGARVVGARPAWPEVVALVLAVLALYFFDRAWDAVREGGPGAFRHRLASRFLGGYLVAGTLAAGASLTLGMIAVPAPVLIGGAVVGLCTAVYFALRMRAGQREDSVPRAGAIGGLFAAGCAVPALAADGFSLRLLLFVVSSAVLFSANVVVCMTAERRGAGHGLSGSNPLLVPAWICALAALPISSAPSLAVAALSGVVFASRRIAPESAAVLADLALLVPAALWVLPG